MRNSCIEQSFLRNNEAVSEEFTVLPALSIVMIGFTLFIVLLAQTYMTYSDHINRLQYYQAADSILQKITNPDCYFIRESGLIDLLVLQKDTESFRVFREFYTREHIVFFLRVQWNNQTQDFPMGLLSPPRNHIAISKEMGVYLNEAYTVPGIATIVLWGES